MFPSRIFRHSAVYVRENSSIREPKELKGRRVGVGGYQMTAAVWVRGFLQQDYGMRPGDIHWVAGRPIREIRQPPGIRLGFTSERLEELLERGALDALVSVTLPRALGHGVRRLFANPREVEARGITEGRASSRSCTPSR